MHTIQAHSPDEQHSVQMDACVARAETEPTKKAPRKHFCFTRPRMASVPAPADSLRAIVEDHDHFILDCDGVIWAAGKPLPGACMCGYHHLLRHLLLTVDTLAMLRGLGKDVLFVTNNSTRSRDEILPKFAKLAIQATKSEIIPATFAVAQYLTTHSIKKAFIIGMP